MEYNLKDLSSTIDNTYNSFADFNASCINTVNQLYHSFVMFNNEAVEFINNLDDKNFENYKEVINRQGEKLDYNFFVAVSDKWLHENFHSDMLKLLLEKDKNCFDSFLKLIEVPDTNYKKYEVGREQSVCYNDLKGSIDIEIVGKDNNNIIIIENKIKWAPDTDRQLYKYYMDRTKNGYTVDKIVYLSPSKNKKPSAQSLGKEDSNAKEEDKKDIKNKFIHIISFDGNDKDLCSCLEEALKNKKDNNKEDDIKVFLKHYIDILKKTGVGDMSAIASKFLEEIKNSKDKNIGEKLTYIKERLDEVDGDINKENLEKHTSKFFTEIKNSKDKDIYEKLAYMKEMLDSSAEIRRDDFIEILHNKYKLTGFDPYAKKAGSHLSKYYLKKIDKKDMNICLQLYTYVGYNNVNICEFKFDDTKAMQEFKNKFEEDINKMGMKKTDERNFDKKFKFPSEDNKALEFIKEMDAILEKL